MGGGQRSWVGGPLLTSLLPSAQLCLQLVLTLPQAQRQDGEGGEHADPGEAPPREWGSGRPGNSPRHTVPGGQALKPAPHSGAALEAAGGGSRAERASGREGASPERSLVLPGMKSQGSPSRVTRGALQTSLSWSGGSGPSSRWCVLWLLCTHWGLLGWGGVPPPSIRRKSAARHQGSVWVAPPPLPAPSGSIAPPSGLSVPRRPVLVPGQR